MLPERFFTQEFEAEAAICGLRRPRDANKVLKNQWHEKILRSDHKGISFSLKLR